MFGLFEQVVHFGRLFIYATRNAPAYNIVDDCIQIEGGSWRVANEQKKLWSIIKSYGGGREVNETI